jgi:hypothetical protein
MDFTTPNGNGKHQRSIDFGGILWTALIACGLVAATLGMVSTIEFLFSRGAPVPVRLKLVPPGKGNAADVTPARGSSRDTVVAKPRESTRVPRDFREHYAPARWEHGWKTARIVATRYRSDVIGFNIGFRFPLDPDNCDRTELVDFVVARGGWPYEMGGHPGAEMFVIFKDVTDRESADKKLEAILPEMSRLVESLGSM